MKQKLLFCAISISLTGLSYADTASPAAAESKQAPYSIEKDIQAYEAAKIAEMKKFQANQDKKKRMSMPVPGPYVDRILTQVEKDPKDSASKNGLLWALRKSRTAQHQNRMAAIFEEHFVNDPIIKEYARSLSRGYSPKMAESLEKIREKTSRDDTKFFCTYYLSVNLEKQAGFNRKLNAEEKKALNEKALKLLKQLHDDPKVAKVSKPLADRVASALFEKENLSIGSIAPDIVGDDHTGTEFKLSDYRGKVVLLDFWGYW